MQGSDFHPPKGWRRISELAVRALEGLGCEVVQVKEKFGTLRIYWNLPGWGSDEAGPRDLLKEHLANVIEGRACDLAATTCQWCGATDSSVDQRRMSSTSCKPCAETLEDNPDGFWKWYQDQ
jgi:hypothetical protein